MLLEANVDLEAKDKVCIFDVIILVVKRELKKATYQTQNRMIVVLFSLFK